MRITKLTTEEAALAELGERLARRRIEIGLTQAEAAREAGVSKRTWERIEAGGSSQLATMIRVLRQLDLMDRLNGLVPEPGPSPMELLERQGKERKRAPRTKRTRGGKIS